MGATELSLSGIQHWRWECVKKKIKHTPSSTPHNEISYPLIMYREDLVLMNEGSLARDSHILPFLHRAVPELPLGGMSRVFCRGLKCND